MGNFFKVVLFSVLLFAGGLSAQTIKFGHIDFRKLLQSMPEQETAQKEIQKITTKLENELAVIQKELNDKGKEYISQQKTLTDAIRATKEEELQALQQRMQNFQQQAQQSLQQEEAKLYQPVLDKARKAVSDVGKEQGLLYVFEVNSLLYHSEQSTDLLPLVKKKLGIK